MLNSNHLATGYSFGQLALSAWLVAIVEPTPVNTLHIFCVNVLGKVERFWSVPGYARLCFCVELVTY